MTSKKTTKVFDHSAVNLMVVSAFLILSINNFNLFSPCSHKKNMSSMCHHHRYGLYFDCFMICSSSSVINKMLYRGAKFVAIAVSRFYLSVFFLNGNCYFFNTTYAKSIMMSVETYFSFWVSSRFRLADKPSSSGMFGYNPTTSIVHKIMRLDNFGRERTFCRN